MVSDLWSHWSAREKAKKPILMFINARPQDEKKSVRRQRDEPARAAEKSRVTWVDIESDDGSDNNMKLVDQEGILGSPDGPPPSKRVRLSERPDVPDEESPAANDADRPMFLSSLNSDTVYKTLISRVLKLPDSVSLFFLHLYGFV